MTQSLFGQAKRTDQRLSVPGDNLVSKPVSGQAGSFYRPRRGFAGLQARRQALQNDSAGGQANSAPEPKQRGQSASAQQQPQQASQEDQPQDRSQQLLQPLLAAEAARAEAGPQPASRAEQPMSGLASEAAVANRPMNLGQIPSGAQSQRLTSNAGSLKNEPELRQDYSQAREFEPEPSSSSSGESREQPSQSA